MWLLLKSLPNKPPPPEKQIKRHFSFTVEIYMVDLGMLLQNNLEVITDLFSFNNSTEIVITALGRVKLALAEKES